MRRWRPRIETANTEEFKAMTPALRRQLLAKTAKIEQLIAEAEYYRAEARRSSHNCPWRDSVSCHEERAATRQSRQLRHILMNVERLLAED
jgi:hypothetical protein